MNYKYSLVVINEESGDIIGKRDFSNPDLISQTLLDVPEWIKKWESEHTTVCVVCGERKNIDDVTFKDTDENYEEPICHDCAEQVIEGVKKLPLVESEDLERRNM